MPQSEDTSLLFQLDGLPTHFANTVFESFSRHLLGRETGRWANFLTTHISQRYTNEILFLNLCQGFNLFHTKNSTEEKTQEWQELDCRLEVS
jgi:hypothetical protein